MKYGVYQLEFLTGVHFGTGSLQESAYTFHADQLFSALCLEALKVGKEKLFYEAAETGKLLFSDGLPYCGDCYYVPKPILYVERKDPGNSEIKKQMKKLGYLPLEALDPYLCGSLDIASLPDFDPGRAELRSFVSVRNENGEALPCRIGVFTFRRGWGLYFLAGYADDGSRELLEELLQMLSFRGIGGKKASGLGRFRFRSAGLLPAFADRLSKDHGRQMLLSAALPGEEELETVLPGSTYLLEKRSGFAASAGCGEEEIRKADLFVFSAGSCFMCRFEGAICDVSDGGSHPVWRMEKPLFLGL